MPPKCDKCISLERQLRDIEVEIEAEIDRRDSGINSSQEQQASQERLTEKLSLFHQTKLIYDLHMQRSHL